MNLQLINFSSGLIQSHSVSEVIKCNRFTEQFGLTLTYEQAVELVETRALSLQDNGRIEFGGGIIDKIIWAFCDSPFISTYNYAQTLHELIEIFYYYKNESLDLISDDELIAAMKSSFNGVCQGSVELLAGRELDRLAKNLRFGLTAGFSGDSETEEVRGQSGIDTTPVYEEYESGDGSNDE